MRLQETFYLPNLGFIATGLPNVIFYSLLIRKFSEIALWLRISRVSQPQKNPANLQGEFGDFCKSCDSLQILSPHFILPKKTKPSSKKILPFRTGRPLSH
jgi:hypothetical protein